MVEGRRRELVFSEIYELYRRLELFYGFVAASV
jgi:hypothetical protein